MGVLVGEGEAVGATAGPQRKLPGDGDDVPGQGQCHILVASARKKTKEAIMKNL